ncbi:MAG: hypothetical protein KKG09_06365 [Verrucomicrobia bacterium]|nr:hypothetical protein [Verrucomicrobiota bacterium]MCG2679926.1 hypothetical protein [Kiritimatiellia bacterium]MBU4247270.1 hypothetical protein [Verrucomicrobiota bacterium]MBU4290551.1 hypothetical protein [Verrucomicrobiota bacterium]MBU4428511.1 hypothetical protein [Verrucomicrobiota bacterium]
MLLATTLDPAVLDEKRCKAEEAYVGCLRDHFRGLIHCHVLIGQKGSNIKAEYQQRLDRLPEGIKNFGEMLIPELRDRFVIIDVPHDEAVLQDEFECEASRAAVTLASVPGIDAAIVHPDTKAAAELHGMAVDKLFTLVAFRSSELADRELRASGAITIGGKTGKEFMDEIVMPSIYWAKHVKMIDKQIGKAVSDQGKNLDSFKSTILLVYDTWQRGHFAKSGKPGRFELITVAANREDGRPVTAESVATAIDPGGRRISFRVKPLSRSRDLYQAQHDRYISTNLDICIGISSGLDVLGNDKTCGAGDAYLRYCPCDENDVIARWEAVEQDDDVFEWPDSFSRYA